jgi:hypothetical protein
VIDLAVSSAVVTDWPLADGAQLTTTVVEAAVARRMLSAPFMAPLSVASARTTRSAQFPAVVATVWASWVAVRPVDSSAASSRRSKVPLLSASQRSICTRPPTSLSVAAAVTVTVDPSSTTPLGELVKTRSGLTDALLFTSTAPMRKNRPALSKSPKPSSSPPSSASTT